MGVAAVCGSGDYQYAPPGGWHAYHGQPARTQRDAPGCGGEDKTGRTKAGDAAYSGSTQRGNTQTGHSKAGDAAYPGSTQSGSSKTGHSEAGDAAYPGSTQNGSSETGRTKAGDAAYPGSAQSGSSKTGHSKAGDAAHSGSTQSGNTKTGHPEAGDAAYSGSSQSGSSEIGRTKVGDAAYPGSAQSGSTETGHSKAPTVKPATDKLPTKPPGLETKKPDSVKPAAPAKTTKAKKPAKPEQVKAVYKVGDKGWKVKQAQQYLQKLGFDPGETSGQFTKATRKALRKFQKKYKLKETGNLDNATYEELKWQAEAKEYGGNVASTKILKTAAQYKGVPYVFGGTTPRGFDCSGYVQYVFAKHGIRLTRTADTQAREGKFVSRKNLKPGDLVFFTTYEPGASHVGIYAGNNLFWNATSSRGIMLSNLTDSYWGPRYYTARRILTGNDRSR